MRDALLRTRGEAVVLCTHAGLRSMNDETSRTTRGVLSRCGSYELLREINRGGTGSVWEGRHVTLGRRVAVKVLHMEAASNPEMVARFEREGMAAARIKHPHVAQMLDVGHDDTRLWLVMEFLEGEDMDELLQREAPLSPERAVDLLLPVIAAMSTAHKVGVVHRDLKPGNIFLARGANGEVVPKIIDFGFSKIHDDAVGGDNLTREDTALGTLSYMPMEQLMAASQAPPASDQYALGVTLYRCVTGRLPFLGSSRYETFKAMSKGVFPSPRELRPELPEEFDTIVLRAMARTPEARFPSMREFGAALVPFASPAMQARWARPFGVPMPSPALPRASTAPPEAAIPRVATSPQPPRIATSPQPPRIATSPQPPRVATSPQPPRVATSPQPPRIATSPQPPRIATSPQPPRIATSPQPPRVATSPQPPRIATSPQPPRVATSPQPPHPISLQQLDALVIAVMVLALVAVIFALR
jgi:serine/threonine-protein kinase